MAAPIVLSDEQLFQLTGNWEAAAALRDAQYNAVNEYNASQVAPTTGGLLSGNILAGASWNSANTALQDALTEATGQATSNYAVGGSTTTDTLNQLNTYLAGGGQFDANATVFLQAGGVDFIQGVDRAVVKDNLNQIVKTLGDRGVNVVLTGSPYAASVQDVVNNNFDSKIDSIYNDVAKANKNVALVNTQGEILKNKALLVDALHTNAEGTSIYNQSVIDAMSQFKNEVPSSTPQAIAQTQKTNTVATTANSLAPNIQNLIASGALQPNQATLIGDTYYQPVYSQTGSGMDAQLGQLENVITYKAGDNKVGGEYKQYTPTGELERTGTQQEVNATKDFMNFALTAGTLFGLPAGIGNALGLSGAAGQAVGQGLLTTGTKLGGGESLSDALKAGLIGGGLVYGGVLQAYSSTASTNTTTGALIVAGGAGIAATVNIGRDLRVFSSLASSSPFTGALVVSGGVGISNNLFVGGGVAFTASIASTSSSTGTLVVTGGVGIGGTLFSSSSFANSLSGVVLNNGSVSLTGTYTQSNSSTTAFSVKDGSNTTAFNIDTIGDVISLPVAVASTSTGTGSLVVAGGVGIGGTLNVGSVNVINNINYYPATGATGGIAWSTISLPAGVSGITKMIYANNKFVGVGNTFAVYSNDGLNWSSVNFTGFSSSENFNNLAFGNGKYVALAGSAATVALYSTDAITWTRSFLPASRVVFRGLAYGNGYFVGIEQSNIPVRSADGINWTSASGLAGYTRNVKFINGLFIATLWLATNEDFTYTSTDGVDWTRLNIPLVISNGITYGNGKYLASSIGTTSPIVSTDLVNWTRLIQPAFYYDQLYTPSYHNGTFYIPNNFSQILYSNDLVNWSYVNAANNEVVYGANKLILANGTSVLVSQSAQGKADISPFLNSSIENTRIGAKSPDSATFTHLSALNNVSFTSPLNSTSVNNGSLVVKGGVGIGQSVNIGGRLDVSNTINYTATNSGIANTWTRIAIPSPVSISGLTYGNGLYVGVGYSAATSTDGITWTARTLPHNLTGVGYGNGLFVGVLSGSALGATSTDGITWRSMALPGSTSWVKVAYGNGIYVANAESSSVAYSYNGFQWTFSSLSSGSNQSTPVEFGGGYFIIRGNASSSYWISTDGINWTRRTNFTTCLLYTSDAADE